jgi:hypothetical protein
LEPVGERRPPYVIPWPWRPRLKLNMASHSRGAIASGSCAVTLEQGCRECRVRAAPAVSCAKCTKESAHEHTGQRRQSDIPCAMALRLMPCSPRRRIRLVTVVCGLRLVQARSGRRVSTDLTSATDARPTRFCRTLQHRSSACRRSLTGLSPTRPAIACHAQRCRVHRIPSRVRDDRDTPLLPGETGEFVGVICPTG